MERVRLNRFLTQCGVCSRREADKLILQGRVEVNGSKAQIGQTVGGEDAVRVNGRLLEGRERKVVLAYYKPVGVVCTERDRHAGIKINDLLDYPQRVTYAGRLDKDSEGLLLLSNDGELINSLMRSANRHEREYIVRVDKEITPDFLLKMSGGIYLKELDTTTRECKLEKRGKYTFQIILTQGLNRQVRRMCRECGYRVRSLKRVRVLNILLGDLRPGEYREIIGTELEELYHGVF